MEADMSAVETQHSYRVLWAQVVLQAKADLDHEPVGSILFNQAAAFFVSRGEWAESRAIVADCLEIHPDDLCRCGERWIAERRQQEGLAPAPLPTPRSKTPRPLPRLEALPAAAPNRQSLRRRITPQSANPFGMKAAAFG
jgi:hypothetical protein